MQQHSTEAVRHLVYNVNSLLDLLLRNGLLQLHYVQRPFSCEAVLHDTE